MRAWGNSNREQDVSTSLIADGVMLFALRTEFPTWFKGGTVYRLGQSE